MAKLTKLRIRKRDARTEVMVLVKHPMEVYRQRNDETKQPGSGGYIDKMSFALNGAVVAEARLGPGVAADPLTCIALKNAKIGDKVTVRWNDKQGESGSSETIIG